MVLKYMQVICVQCMFNYCVSFSEGVTTIYNVRHIYRGYTDIVKHLKELGANIWTEEV